MYTDTHLHFSMVQERLATDASEILEAAAQSGAFLLDIGTAAGDLEGRRRAVGKALVGVNINMRERAAALVHYSAGIWPDAEAIKNRDAALKTLEESIAHFSAGAQGCQRSPTAGCQRSLAAIGECGLDHHWNPTGADKRSEDDFGAEELKGEAELFEAQLLLGKRMNLPVIVHSRDAYEGTMRCIKNAGYDKGVIHCFSYGKDEAKAFLERGWHIAFGGGVTYTKKSKMDALRETVQCVPDEAILVETDAPYLAPEPMRGRPNTPLYIDYTYKFLAQLRGVSTEALADLVQTNAQRLFGWNNTQ